LREAFFVYYILQPIEDDFLRAVFYLIFFSHYYINIIISTDSKLYLFKKVKSVFW